MSDHRLNGPPGLALVDDLAARGRATFTTAEALATLGGSIKATQGVLRRLRQRGEIATPIRGFHVILPPEHRAQGCRPAVQFIDSLATWLETSYYLALLSAAELHGAAHQRPQLTQVMVPSARRPVRCGSVHIEFVLRENTAAIPVTMKNTPTGTVRVATAEATAVDLVGYVEHCGGLGNVATVIRELVEEMSGERLAAVLATSPAAWGQRLGYLLESVGAHELATVVAGVVADTRPVWTPLDPRVGRTGAHSQRWRLILNSTVEADE